MAEAVAGIHYISFRSSRVWSSILCVQRCSSLVDFSLSGREQELRVTNQHQTTENPLPKKACASPFPTRCSSNPWTRVPGWVQLEALLPGLCAALTSPTAGAPSQHGHGAPLARALGSGSHAGVSDCSQLFPGLPHLHSWHTWPSKASKSNTHLETTPWNYSWLCPPSPQHRAGMPSPAAGSRLPALRAAGQELGQ